MRRLVVDTPTWLQKKKEVKSKTELGVDDDLSEMVERLKERIGTVDEKIVDLNTVQMPREEEEPVINHSPDRRLHSSFFKELTISTKCKRPHSDTLVPVDGGASKRRKKEEAVVTLVPVDGGASKKRKKEEPVVVSRKKTGRNTSARRHTKGSNSNEKRNQKLISDWFSVRPIASPTCVAPEEGSCGLRDEEEEKVSECPVREEDQTVLVVNACNISNVVHIDKFDIALTSPSCYRL